MPHFKYFNPSCTDRLSAFRRIHPDGLVKILVILLLCAIIIHRIFTFDAFPGTWESTLRHFRYHARLTGREMPSVAAIQWFWAVRLTFWMIISANLVACIIAYWTRVSPVKRASGMMETVFPLAVSGIPFIVVLFRPRLFLSVTRDPDAFFLYLLILILMSLGGMIAFWGIFYLRRSFSLWIEVRALVQSGPYRRVRHPIYLGVFIMFLGTCLLHFNSATVFLYLLFVAGQMARCRLEEEKLAVNIPEYASYQARTGMFFPRLR